MIVLDTNVMSELIRPRADPGVILWADQRRPEDLFATAITEAEMLHGVARLPEGRRKDDLTRAVRALFASLLSGRVLPFDSNAAAHYALWAAASQAAGRSIGMADLQIAAIARAHGAAAIATRNVRDFEGCGIALINPWEDAS